MTQSFHSELKKSTNLRFSHNFQSQWGVVFLRGGRQDRSGESESLEERKARPDLKVLSQKPSYVIWSEPSVKYSLTKTSHLLCRAASGFWGSSQLGSGPGFLGVWPWVHYVTSVMLFVYEGWNQIMLCRAFGTWSTPFPLCIYFKVSHHCSLFMILMKNLQVVFWCVKIQFYLTFTDYWEENSAGVHVLEKKGNDKLGSLSWHRYRIRVRSNVPWL